MDPSSIEVNKAKSGQRSHASGNARSRSRAEPRWVIAALIVASLVFMDSQQPPNRQIGTRWALASIRLYQVALSDRLATFGTTCRFKPTCSRYAQDVLAHRGLWSGMGLTLGRLARCGPWTPKGTKDAPPLAGRTQR
jgi:putative membrane protein insertion efficiency factor